MRLFGERRIQYRAELSLLSYCSLWGYLLGVEKAEELAKAMLMES